MRPGDAGHALECGGEGVAGGRIGGGKVERVAGQLFEAEVLGGEQLRTSMCSFHEGDGWQEELSG